MKFYRGKNMIEFNQDNKIFHLHTKSYSYYFLINPLGYLIHLYSGEYLNEVSIERLNERYIERYSYYNNDQEICDESYYFSGQGSLFECSSNLKSDKRGAFIIIKDKNGSTKTNFKYYKHEIFNKKLSPSGLPHFKDDENVETLVITLKEETHEVYLKLFYVIYENYDVIIRFSQVINKENEEIHLLRISSFELDSINKDYVLTSIHGQWSDDRELEEVPLNHSKLVVSDNHGARGFRQNPSIMVKSKDTTYDNGEVMLFSLVYSGNFKYELGLDEYDQVRILSMINDESFDYILNKDEDFYSPECLMVYSSKGVNKATQTMHDLIRNNLIESNFAFKERALLINSWEPFLFNFDTEKIKQFILDSKALGIEMVVLDDGWFGKRNDDTSSLGDWEVNLEKINLKEITDFIHENNMKFGLWVEPEMISFNSKLFKEHSEYVLTNIDENPTLLRHQLVLDLTNDEVINYIFDKLSKIFDSYKIDYCKWDFNRYLSEISSKFTKEGEIYHKFTLGTYKLLELFKTRYKDILLETCASGGGRFDLGMLYYSPQIWGSDETNPYSRVMIQFSTNMFYPLSTIGAHVSASNALSVQDKAIISLFGTYGYELDPNKLSVNEKEEVIKANAIFKMYHHIVTNGDYYVLKDPYKSNYASWMTVTKDKKEALVFHFNFKREATKGRFIVLKGLNKDKHYYSSLTNDVNSGDFYMKVGLNLSAPLKEGQTVLVILKQVD